MRIPGFAGTAGAFIICSDTAIPWGSEALEEAEVEGAVDVCVAEVPAGEAVVLG